MARPKVEDEEDGSGDFPDAQDYALAILECLTAAEWMALHELAARYTSGRLSYRAWRTAAAHAVRTATRLMGDELFGR